VLAQPVQQEPHQPVSLRAQLALPPGESEPPAEPAEHRSGWYQKPEHQPVLAQQQVLRQERTHQQVRRAPYRRVLLRQESTAIPLGYSIRYPRQHSRSGTPKQTPRPHSWPVPPATRSPTMLAALVPKQE
jgi:hypothetical protein